MTTETQDDITRCSIISTNQYFKTLFDLVPPKAYFDAESNQKLSDHRSHSQIGFSHSDERSTQNGKNVKHLMKKVKLDPAQPGKTTELQQVLPKLKDTSDLQTNNHVPNDTKQLLVMKKPVNGFVKSLKHSSARNSPSLKRKIPSQSDENSSCSSSVPSPAALAVNVKLNPDQLREKLRTRIQDLKAKRLHGMTPEEYLETQKLRRKASKLKSKQKRKENKKLRLSVEKQAKNNQNKLNGVSEVTSQADNKNSSNNNKMVFSKFEFSDQAKKPKDRKQKKPKSYRELYEKVTKDKEKLEELKQTDADKAKKISEKNAWRKAMDQSKGVKVKDNPELIKKSMKKEEKLKQRSQKKWQERTATVSDQQQKRQDKRKKNILAKKQTKVDRKVKLAKKKGRMISGF